MTDSGPSSTRPLSPATHHRLERPITRDEREEQARPASPPGSAANAASAAGEPSLWDVLTPEEREFFEQQATLGLLTYRPRGAGSNASLTPTGRRIDVRG